jgi:hypothetical protein
VFVLSTLFLATKVRIFRFEYMNGLLVFIFFLVSSTSTCAQDCDTCDIFVPNTLTPDCEEFGCEFLKIVSNCEISEFELSIYNRWGELVFESVDQQKEFNSTTVKEGAYVWKLTGIFCNTLQFSKTGNLQIIK